MAKKKKVKPIQYSMFQDNDYIKRLRDDVNTYGDWLDANALDYFGANSSLNRDIYNTQAANAYNTMWNDTLANYRKANNQLAAANYNRFGGLGSTGSKYNQELFNRQQNDLMNRLASQEYQMAEGLYQQELANRFNAAKQIYGMFNNAGNTTTNIDLANWDTTKQNEANRVNAENYNNANKTSWFDYVTNAISGSANGAAQGFSATGSPWGALGGGVAGAVGGVADAYSGTGNKYQNALISPFTAMNNMKMGGLGGLGNGLNFNSKGGGTMAIAGLTA